MNRLRNLLARLGGWLAIAWYALVSMADNPWVCSEEPCHAHR